MNKDTELSLAARQQLHISTRQLNSEKLSRQLLYFNPDHSKHIDLDTLKTYVSCIICNKIPICLEYCNSCNKIICKRCQECSGQDDATSSCPACLKQGAVYETIDCFHFQEIVKQMTEVHDCQVLFEEKRADGECVKEAG